MTQSAIDQYSIEKSTYCGSIETNIAVERPSGPALILLVGQAPIRSTGADQPRSFFSTDGGYDGAVIERIANATVGRDKSIFVVKKFSLLPRDKVLHC